MKWGYVFGLCCMACAVGISVYVLYPTKTFENPDVVAKTIGFISAAIFFTANSALKMIATHETWLYSSSRLKSHRWWCHFIRYLSIVLATILVGILMYYISFDVTTMEYSESLWNRFRVLAGVAAGIMTALPWGLSKL